MASQTPVEFAAQLWCRPENEHRQMDVELAQGIADAVAPIMQERDDLKGALTVERERITELEDMQKAVAPPMVEEMDMTIRGKALSIRTSPRYTILSIDGSEVYFRREDGKYEGLSEAVAG